MHERRFHGDVDRLRTPERIKLLEVKRVVKLSLDNIYVKSVLDIGTGSGLFAEEFAEHGLEVSGIDVSEEMLKEAQKYLPHGNFKKGLAEDIPFPDGSFDLVFLGVVLHETDDLNKALNEAKRVSKNRVAILEWPYTKGEYGPPLEHRINPELLSSLIKKSGFKDYKKVSLSSLELHLLTP